MCHHHIKNYIYSVVGSIFLFVLIHENRVIGSLGEIASVVSKETTRSTSVVNGSAERIEQRNLPFLRGDKADSHGAVVGRHRREVASELAALIGSAPHNSNYNEKYRESLSKPNESRLGNSASRRDDSLDPEMSIARMAEDITRKQSLKRRSDHRNSFGEGESQSEVENVWDSSDKRDLSISRADAGEEADERDLSLNQNPLSVGDDADINEKVKDFMEEGSEHGELRGYKGTEAVTEANEVKASKEQVEFLNLQGTVVDSDAIKQVSNHERLNNHHLDSNKELNAGAVDMEDIPLSDTVEQESDHGAVPTTRRVDVSSKSVESNSIGKDDDKLRVEYEKSSPEEIQSSAGASLTVPSALQNDESMGLETLEESKNIEEIGRKLQAAGFAKQSSSHELSGGTLSNDAPGDLNEGEVTIIDLTERRHQITIINNTPEDFAAAAAAVSASFAVFI